jgi:Xaa-Pro aminopeptidase
MTSQPAPVGRWWSSRHPCILRAVNLDWHADRSDLPALRLIDRAPPSEGIDFEALRRHRLARVRARMAERGIAACVLLDPVNIRYATGARNMQVFHLRNPSRYLLVTVDGPVVLFEFTGAMHLAEGLETIDEVRPASTASFAAAGPEIAEAERRWASETAALIRRFCGGPNELVALDTDVVGCHGYYCDFSRTFHAGPDAPSAAQKELYRHAVEQVRHNMDVIRPGMTFREYAGKAWAIPERYVANRYFVSAHGCGMTGEYPYLYHGMDFDDAGYDGVIEPGMTLCVESYIGEEGGTEGVKLEEHCLVTERGLEPLSQFPLEDRLL